MKKVAVMTDSGADITTEQAQQAHIYVSRMPLMIDNKEVKENDEITTEEVIELMKQGKVVKTAQSVLGEIMQMWQDLLEEYDEVLFIPLSSGLSGAYQSAATLAKNFDGRVTVVDAKTACFPLQFICQEAVKMLEEGISTAQIKQYFENDTYMFAALIPEKLEYLKRGGRISPAAAALGNLLKICPVLKVDHGSIDVIGKVRTLRKAYDLGLEEVCKVDDFNDYYWAIISCDVADETVQSVKQRLAEMTGQEVMEAQIGSIIMAHTGPGTLAFGRIKKWR